MANPSSQQYYIKAFIWSVISCISFITMIGILTNTFNTNDIINLSSFDISLIMVMLKYKVYILSISAIGALSMAIFAVLNYYKLGCA